MGVTSNITGRHYTGCYDTFVTNPNAIWQSENVLAYYLPTLATQVAFMVFITRFLFYILKPFNQPRLVAEMLVSTCIYKFVSIFPL